MSKHKGVEFEPGFFQMVLNSPTVVNLELEAAYRVQEIAQANAPVDTGAYRDGIHVRERKMKDRKAVEVAAEDWKSLIIESRTGNLSRAMKQARKG